MRRSGRGTEASVRLPSPGAEAAVDPWRRNRAESRRAQVAQITRQAKDNDCLGNEFREAVVMLTNARQAHLPAVAVGLALVIAACGSSGPTGTPPSAISTAAAATEKKSGRLFRRRA